MLDEPVLEGFGFPKLSPFMRAVVTAALRLRARLLRLLPARRRPFLRTEMRRRSYPNGYGIEELGPPNCGSKAARRPLEHDLNRQKYPVAPVQGGPEPTPEVIQGSRGDDDPT